MEAPKLLTITGNLWHYNMLGLGLIYTYNSNSHYLQVLCSSTGQETLGIEYTSGPGFLTPADFEKEMKELYLEMTEDGVTPADFELSDEPTIVGCVGIDFELLKN